jgi:endonuclease/exonuclease/phosphatase family metal-dependent hydrolase
VNSENAPLINKPRPEDLFTRHWGKVVIELPNKELISVHSAHLHPHDNPVSAEIRQREIAEIIKSMENDLKSDKSILVIGDLNHTPAMPEYNQWMNAGLKDTYAVSGIGDGLTIRADTPSKRIDFILAAGPIAEQIIESKALFEGAFRTNPLDPESYALSDHLPQYAKFKI